MENGETKAKGGPDVVEEKEDEEFGGKSWLLISRHVDDGIRTSVKGLAIQGKGVLVQTMREEGVDDEWGMPEYDQPVLVPDVLMMEYYNVSPSEVTDDQGQPLRISRKCVNRELVSVKTVRDRLQPGKADRDKQRQKIIKSAQTAKTDEQRQKLQQQMLALNQQGPQDQLMIIAGVVLTQEQTPAPKPMMSPGAQPSMPQA